MLSHSFFTFDCMIPLWAREFHYGPVLDVLLLTKAKLPRESSCVVHTKCFVPLICFAVLKVFKKMHIHLRSICVSECVCSIRRCVCVCVASRLVLVLAQIAQQCTIIDKTFVGKRNEMFPFCIYTRMK